MLIPKELEEAIDQFKTLPGIGAKSAYRNLIYLLSKGEHSITDFYESIKRLNEISNCEVCGIYVNETQSICEICKDESREKSICVVENFKDVVAIEESRDFFGKYHCLGGVLNPLIGIGPKDLNIESLVQRVESNNFETIILAINPSMEGQATCSYLNELMSQKVKIERIGFGMPLGGSLEYLDSRTISTALRNRKTMI